MTSAKHTGILAGMNDGLKNHITGHDCEEMFDAECVKRGIRTRLPAKSNGPIDRYVLGFDRELAIQIKYAGTVTLQRRGAGKGGFRPVVVASNRREDHKRTRFADAGVDFIALYAVPFARWHIFPADTFKGNRIKVSRCAVGAMAGTIEAWHLLIPEIS